MIREVARSMIALVIVTAAAVFLVNYAHLPSEFLSILFLVLGFYFGRDFFRRE